ncbi:MAG: glycosyltransferase family 4 protein [Candidatus Sabulitectum sp.]|nr:glycosyltransferase family 4 protein [Candidatus Sabulitectum sp.]
MSIHLLIDARAVQKNVDGISRFSLNVTKCIMEKRPEWKITALIGKDAEFHLENTGAEIILDDSSRFSTSANRKLSNRINIISPDAFLNFSMAGPQPDAPSIITVHDLMVLNLPCYFGDSIIRNAFSRFLFRRALKASIGHASAIAVPTMTTKLDVMRSFQSATDMVFITGEGQALFSSPVQKQLERQNFFLYVGNARGYKNIPRFLTAYGRLWAMDEKTPPLSMVVRKDRAYNYFKKHLDSNPARSNIKVMTHISDDELRNLYLTCKALLIPSVYEGFGLPALEAMATGAPVMASKNTALEEVVGDTGVLIDPYSIIDIMRGMAELSVATPEKLKELGELGRERSTIFSWEKTTDCFLRQIEALI